MESSRMNVFVDNPLTGDVIAEVQVTSQDTIAKLRAAAEDSACTLFKLFFKGVALHDSLTLGASNIQDNDRISAVAVTWTPSDPERSIRVRCSLIAYCKMDDSDPVSVAQVTAEGSKDEPAKHIVEEAFAKALGATCSAIGGGWRKTDGSLLALEAAYDLLNYRGIDLQLAAEGFDSPLKLGVPKGDDKYGYGPGVELMAPPLLLQELRVEYGECNPTRCTTASKLAEMGLSYHVKNQWGVEESVWNMEIGTKPLWRGHKQRWDSCKVQIDDGRVVWSGGEYEDSYDPMFCIFNDILVEFPDGRTSELYKYPRHDFPPTDFHVGIQVGGQLYFFGNAGYPEDRSDQIQVLRMDLDSYQVTRLKVQGPGPPWCNKRSLMAAKTMFDRWSWRLPEDLSLCMTFAANAQGRIEAFIGDQSFGPVVRLKAFKSICFIRQAESDYIFPDELPSERVIITADRIEFLWGASNGEVWIIARLDDELGAVFRTGHPLKVGMQLNITDGASDSSGESENLPPVRVLRKDGSFFGLLHGHNQSHHKATGLTYLNSMRLLTEDTIECLTEAKLEDNAEYCIANYPCVVYRPLPLLLAELALRDAEEGGDAENLAAARRQLKVEEEALVAGEREPDRGSHSGYEDSTLRSEGCDIVLTIIPEDRNAITKKAVQQGSIWRLDTKALTWHAGLLSEG